MAQSDAGSTQVYVLTRSRECVGCDTDVPCAGRPPIGAARRRVHGGTLHCQGDKCRAVQGPRPPGPHHSRHHHPNVQGIHDHRQPYVPLFSRRSIDT
eukprot:9214441-Pyramimonas_sp.AAC.1